MKLLKKCIKNQNIGFISKLSSRILDDKIVDRRRTVFSSLLILDNDLLCRFVSSIMI